MSADLFTASAGAAPVPVYTDEHLVARPAEDLWRLLITSEDRVPRNLIDECARRGDEFLDAASALLDKDYYWSAPERA